MTLGRWGRGSPGRLRGHGCGRGGELGSLASALMVGKRVNEPCIVRLQELQA